MATPAYIDSRHRPATRPKRSKALGMLLILGGPLLAIFLVLVLYSFFRGELLILGGLLLAVGAQRIVNIGRRMRVPDGWSVLERDNRPPVLLLRPFQEDSRVSYDQPIGFREGGTDPARASAKPVSRESRIARELAKIGPFVATGQPGESLPPLGAARLYVADDQWRETITSLVKRSAVVVLQPELSPGTLWEVALVAQTLDLRRLLLLVPDPSLRPLAFERVRSIVAQFLGISLPSVNRCPPCDAFMFDEGHTPIPIRFGRWFRPALKPFVQQVQRLNANPAKVT
jgi:hypothetical protein